MSVQTVAESDAIDYQGLKIPNLAGSILTVLGPVTPDSLGDTLMHEHLFMKYYLPPDEPERWKKGGIPMPGREEINDIMERRFTIETRNELLPYIGVNKDANTLDSVEDAIAETRAYEKLGGGAIVDVTPIGLGRDPKKIQAVAEKTTVKIIMSAGFYRESWLPKGTEKLTIADMTRRIVGDIVEGVDGTAIRAGVVGEIPIDDLVCEPKESQNLKGFKAACRASVLTGAPLSLSSVHDRAMQTTLWPLVLDLAEQEGVDLSRVSLGHACLKDVAMLERLLERGVYIQYDTFGSPTWLSDLCDTPGMADAIVDLVKCGYSKQILVSHNYLSKYHQSKYGGHGLTFIHNQLIPALLERGVSDEAIGNIMRENPRRILAFAPPKNLVNE